MQKQKNVFICNECGYECGKWLGKCPSCGEWNTLVEQAVSVRPEQRPHTSSAAAIPLRSVEYEDVFRMSTGIPELDNVLGGGIVPASLILCGGDPGVGKSTLLLQTADSVASSGKTVLYISAEESARQVRLRADRLGTHCDSLLFLAETSLSNIISELERTKPRLAVIDSVQTIYCDDVSGVQGSVPQVRECTSRLMHYAKNSGTSVVLVGHVTKDGSLAGPKVLEHLVDTVLYFEGEQSGAFRILRAVKNRFGSSNEIGIFEMSDRGMLPVANPSEQLLRRECSDSGSAVMCVLEGTRPLLCEVQALAARTAFVSPRRSGSGVDFNRMAMLLAVLEKKLGYVLYDKDVYINIAGGLKVNETAADLAILAAVASTVHNISISTDTVFFGEVGLSGELRGVSQAAKRVTECVKLGFKHIIVPSACKKDILPVDGIDIKFVSTLEAALRTVLH